MQYKLEEHTPILYSYNIIVRNSVAFSHIKERNQMNTRTTLLIILLIATILVLIVRLIFLHFQIYRMTVQLEEFVKGKSRKKFRMASN